MKKLFAWLKKQWNAPSPLEAAFIDENKFINENEQKAIDHLESMGWNILAKDTRICFFGFRIQKGDQIHDVSLREALKIK